MILLGGVDHRRHFAVAVGKKGRAPDVTVGDSAGYIWEPYENVARPESGGIRLFAIQKWRNLLAHTKTLFAAVTIKKKVNNFAANKIGKDLEDLFVAFVESYSCSDRLKLRDMVTPHLFSKIKKSLHSSGSGKQGRRTGLQVVGFHDNANLLQLRILRASADSKQPAFAQATVSFKPTLKPAIFTKDGSAIEPRKKIDPVVSLEEGAVADIWRKAMDENGREYFFNSKTQKTQWTVPDDYVAVRASLRPGKIARESVQFVEDESCKYGIEQRVVFELPLLSSSPQWRVASF
eukprot:g1926.t1